MGSHPKAFKENMKKEYLLISVLLAFCLALGFFVGNKEHIFEHCPKGQVIVGNECFTPGVYYADSRRHF